MRTPLAKRQIAPQCADARHRELVCQRDQQWPVAISARAMRKHEKSSTRSRPMKKSPDRSCARGVVDKWFCFAMTHD